jgi:hypothetical protein
MKYTLKVVVLSGLIASSSAYGFGLMPPLSFTWHTLASDSSSEFLIDTKNMSYDGNNNDGYLWAAMVDKTENETWVNAWYRIRCSYHYAEKVGSITYINSKVADNQLSKDRFRSDIQENSPLEPYAKQACNNHW